MKTRRQQILWFAGIVVCVAVTSIMMPAGATAQDFGYACEICPANWGNIDPAFSLCNTGSEQSPIAVSTKDAKRKRLPRLRVAFEESDFEVVRPNPTNFEAEPDEQIGIRIGQTEYTLLQFHFHSRSEHFVNGEQFPLEAHFVHQNEDGDLSVLAVFIKEGKANGEIDRLLAILDDVEELDVGEEALLEGFDPGALLPNKLKTLRYVGSTTTPPCLEDVLWLLLERPVTLSAEQIEPIQAVIRGFNDGFDNNRPVQPLNGRRVFLDRKGGDDDDDDDEEDS